MLRSGMNNETWIGKKGFEYWYYKFRDSEYYGIGVIGFILLVCLILLFNIIIPEVTRWFSIRDEITATQSRIAILQKNINFVNTLDKNSLDSQIQTVSHALPPEKNFGYILNALSSAAANSGTSLNDFSFQLGDISSSKKGGTVLANGTALVEITVSVNGNLVQIRNFIKSIENNLPLSQITNVNGAGQTVSIRLQFYQKPFTKVSFTGDTPLTGLSPNKAALLKSLAKWDHTSNDQKFSVQTGSGSAVPLF